MYVHVAPSLVTPMTPRQTGDVNTGDDVGVRAGPSCPQAGSSSLPVARIRRLSTSVRSSAGGQVRGGGNLAACHLPDHPLGPPRRPPRSPGCATPASCSPHCPTSSGSTPDRSCSSRSAAVRRRIELTQRVGLPGEGDAAAVCGALAANTLRVSRPGSRWSWWVATRRWPGECPSAAPAARGAGGVAEATLTARGVHVQSRTWAGGTGAGAAWAATTSAAAAEPCPMAAPPRSRHRGRRRSGRPRRPRRAGEARRTHDTGSPPRRARMLTHRRRERSDALCHRLRTAGWTAGPTVPTAPRGVRPTPVPRDRPVTHSWTTRSPTPRRGGCASTTRGWSRSRWPCPIWRCATRHWPAARARSRTVRSRTGLSTCGPRSRGRRRIRRPPSLQHCWPPARSCAGTVRWPGSRWTGRSRRGRDTGSPRCCARCGRRACRPIAFVSLLSATARGDAGPTGGRSEQATGASMTPERRSDRVEGRWFPGRQVVRPAGAAGRSARRRRRSSRDRCGSDASPTPRSPPRWRPPARPGRPRGGADIRRDRVAGHGAAGLDHLAHREAGARCRGCRSAACPASAFVSASRCASARSLTWM